MPTLQIFPPEPETAALLAQLPGFRETPAPVISFQGPLGHLGPEAAGAVLVLHMTMVDEERTKLFWRQVELTCKAASAAPGFIRLISLFDGLANWALAFWRTPEDAKAYARSEAHRAAMAEMYKTNFEYTHFAGVFAALEARTREVYCDRCGTQSLMPAGSCPSCGNELVDVFEVQAPRTVQRPG
jgi:heme-degrading monooxygenase HmoA